MKARGLVWLGTRTRNFDETVRLAWAHFRGPDGSVYEVTTPAKRRLES